MKIGLVLAGGIAKGAYQFGFCRALSTFLSTEDIAVVSASSVGVWNALCLLTGRLDIIEEMWTGLNAVGLHDFRNKFIKNGLVREHAKRLAEGASGLNCDLYGVCCETPGMTPNYVNLRETAPELLPAWLSAFVSIPVLFQPVSIGAKQYFDGGTVDNVPLAPLSGYGLDVVLAMHFDPSYKLDNGRTGAKCALEFVYEDKGFLKASLDFSEETVHRRIRQGYDAACKVMERHFIAGARDMDRIAALAGRRKPGPFRWTFDSVLNRFNSAVRRIVLTDDTACDQA